MFRGISSVNLDTKGRMAIPTRYREQLTHDNDGQMVVTIDTDTTCLLLYPFAEWEVIERKLEALPSFNRAARRIQRLLIGHATDVDIDANGRILLPPLLREYAELEKKVVLIGQGKKFEVWSEAKWNESRLAWLSETIDEDDDDIPPEMMSLSL